ncbi:MAG: hypothetical protein V2I76_08205, partial [Roseobacter sp.]|nr:hypothetical protein [Roseobacter sp.]
MTAEDVEKYFSTSIEAIQSNSWHQSPHYQAWAVTMSGNLGAQTQFLSTIKTEPLNMGFYPRKAEARGLSLEGPP